MLNFNQQFLESLSHYLNEDIDDRKQLMGRTFDARDMELFSRQYFEDMSRDDVKKDLRALKIFYFSAGVITIMIVLGILIYKR